MKSLQAIIIWRVLVYVTFFLIVLGLVVTYLIVKKSETTIASNIEYIRDSKYKSLNKDNLSTGFDFDHPNYTVYIVNERGELLIQSSYPVDEEIRLLCARTADIASESYTKEGITKRVAIKKNGGLCLIVEANVNSSIVLGTFILEVFAAMIVLLLLLMYFFLRRSYIKIYTPIKDVSNNAENALNSRWEDIKPAVTKIPELLDLNKFSLYLIDLLKQNKGTGTYDKISEVREFQGKFLNKKLENDANKFRLAVDSAPDIVVIVDKFGYINYANKALTTIIGVDYSDVENKKITDVWHKEDDINLWKQKYEEVARDKKPVQFISWGTKKNNIRFESSIQISPIKNGSDSIDSYLVVDRDVTEEKQKERIKTEFISVVSHELRTPMTVIRGYSTLLAEGKLGELNDKQKEYINKINAETGQLLELANDMLDLQKFESGKIELKFENTNIPKFIQNIVDEFTEQYSKKALTIKMENNLKTETANIDLKYFTRVITNLLTNAYKYSEKGGVQIFLVNPDDKHLVIAVKDTGVGIKEEALSHLFERFYQAQGVMQRKQEGSGLGLSIVKTVAEAHGGIVWVESKEGVGSTFYVAIPLT